MLIQKVLNNNVLIASHPEYKEVILTGKGIGFGKEVGASISLDHAERFFVLKGQEEQEQYKQLLEHVDEQFIGVMNECIDRLEKRFGVELHEHIHVGLTDHLFYAIKRIKQGLDIRNPFLKETELAYPKEYAAALEIVEWLKEKLHVSIPIGEVGFITLHIHSALTNRDISEINRHTHLILEMVQVIEESLKISIDRSDINYLRLVRHFHASIERVINEQHEKDNQEVLAKVLQGEYPVCYNLAWKLIKIMQQELRKPVPGVEAVYLTLHLQRLSKQ
ncbi:glucose PTS transporter transcription antiterminator GlcT [Mangrovibacillus cuniculi]|uniref:Transcription antiterminator n=1 Tax=Mangrovibacillus cuniculi TaxID=2593652 RepID=A0A7S8CEG0_9BACI|nr:transcription antiterminator [Mangrovibacillus cuniculi]QPC48313.1 transcription antiterminator [Mangrovibacillus cuniculi]